MEMVELVLWPIFALITFFPVGYIFYKKGKNKLFFISSCIGVYSLIVLLLGALAMPFGLFLVKVIPQLAEYDQVRYILPLLYMAEIIQEYYFIALYPIFMVVLPVAIHRRYEIFHLTNQASGTPKSGAPS